MPPGGDWRLFVLSEVPQRVAPGAGRGRRPGGGAGLLSNDITLEESHFLCGGLCLQIYSFCRRCANRFLGVLITFYGNPRHSALGRGRKFEKFFNRVLNGKKEVSAT